MSETENLLEIEFTKDIFSELMPEWQGSEVDIKILSGGITNKLYRVQSEMGDVAVRIYGDKTELFIERDYEADAIEKMAGVGISPKLIKYLPGWSMTIVEYITGSSPKILARIFEIANIPENEYTASHNDLLAENFIMVTEGYEGKYSEPMYIIDWEYAGMAPRYYDIGDMFQEILVPCEVEKSIVEHYCEGRDFDKNLYLIDLFKPFPDIYWFLWSMIQKNISKIEFDFYNYGKVKYENARSNIEFAKEEYGVKI